MFCVLAGAASNVGWWWRQGDHFDWLSSYLAARGIRRAVQYTIASAAAALAVSTLTLAAYVHGAGSGPAVAGLLVAACTGIASAVLWFTQWPPRWQSAVFVLAGDATIALQAVVRGQPLLCLLGCAAFALIGGYVAVFHSPRYIVAHTALTVLTTAAVAVWADSRENALLVVSQAWLVLLVNLAVPFAIQVVVHTLGVDVAAADYDALTGLLTRRAFFRSVPQMLAEARQQSDSHLGCIMIDLDKFKQVNDCHGHAAGDRALVATARVLRRLSPPTSLIGRVGGEEFILAVVGPVATGPEVGADVCRAVSAELHPLTASVGIHTVALHEFHVDKDDCLADVIARADAAMYVAKRAGGDQVYQLRFEDLGQAGDNADTPTAPTPPGLVDPVVASSQLTTGRADTGKTRAPTRR
jgi:diguanylate cyclase